jgi:hypothetical protein
MIEIEIVEAMDDELLKEAWELYYLAFEGLNAYAVQRHLMYRGEFDDVMRDPRIQKYLAYADGVLVGLSTYTNELDAVPLISPAYFERRWPDLYAEKLIWYCGFVAVHPDAQGSGPFREMVSVMCVHARDRGGIISLDTCRKNTDERHMGQVIPLMLRRAIRGPVRTECLDEQSYWLYEFPAAGVKC